jgi:hypothetical protein
MFVRCREGLIDLDRVISVGVFEDRTLGAIVLFVQVNPNSNIDGNLYFGRFSTRADARKAITAIERGLLEGAPVVNVADYEELE